MPLSGLTGRSYVAIVQSTGANRVNIFGIAI